VKNWQQCPEQPNFISGPIFTRQHPPLFESEFTHAIRTAQKCMEIREQTFSQMMIFDQGFQQTIDTRDN
jgi:hypothetical protein